MAPISVVIPCYQCAHTIERAVESVARQTSVPAQLILVDDGSDDDTLERLFHLREQYERGWISIFCLPDNKGPSRTRNVGWNAASQPYVAFLDADDSWHSQKIEIQYGWMTAHPDIAISAHRFCVKRNLAPPKPVVPASVVATRLSRRALLLSNHFSTSTVMLKRTIPNRFDEAKRYSEDFHLWLEICMQENKHVVLSPELTFLHKAPFGEGGLSRDLKAMTRGELDTYSRLSRSGYISVGESAFLKVWCLLKYARRIALMHIAARLGGPNRQEMRAKEFEHPGSGLRPRERGARLPVLPETPLVSVVTPSYNSGQFIAHTLRSVQDQTYARVEHIVLDASSTDGTQEILSQFPSATVIRGAPAGMCEKVNLGFALAHGEVVAWLNADDYYLPGAIQSAVDALKKNPDVGLVYCNDLRVNDSGEEIRRIVCRQTDNEELVRDQNFVPNPTAFFRREALDAAGPVDARFPLVSDWDLWIRISRHYPILYVDAWWAAFREHEGQLSDAYRFTAWLQGRRMTRNHGATFLPLSWSYWRRMGSQALSMMRRRAYRAINSGLRAVIGATGR